MRIYLSYAVTNKFSNGMCSLTVVCGFPGNILPNSTAAPSLQEKQRELAKHMRADSLEQKIQQRPKPEELVKEGILDEDPTSPVKE